MRGRFVPRKLAKRRGAHSLSRAQWEDIMDYDLQKLADFVRQSDEFFRTVPKGDAVHLVYKDGLWAGSIGATYGGYGFKTLQSLFKALTIARSE